MTIMKSTVFLMLGLGAFAVPSLALPSAAMAQAAVTSDQPVGSAGRAGGLNALPAQGTGLDAPGSRDVPNPQTGPGSPGTTGTGAVGTGPTGTMAAPGR